MCLDILPVKDMEPLYRSYDSWERICKRCIETETQTEPTLADWMITIS